MATFSKEISNFQIYGIYEYNFDEGGNLVFDSGSLDFHQHYLSIPLVNYTYNNVKIGSFYSNEFSEFIPTKTEVTSSISVAIIPEEVTQLTEENQQLKNQLSVLTELSNANITEAERMAIKDIIVNLRMQLKQGITENDFSDVFPYLPFTKDTR